MIHTASLCIRRDPHLRPRMSQVKKITILETCSFLSQYNSLIVSGLLLMLLLLKVLRLLEGDMVMNEISERFSGRLSIETGQRS